LPQLSQRCDLLRLRRALTLLRRPPWRDRPMWVAGRVYLYTTCVVNAPELAASGPLLVVGALTGRVWSQRGLWNGV
jgi:hypothetical protein